MEYPLPMTTLTKRMCNKITSVISAAALPRSGIMRSESVACTIEGGWIKYPQLVRWTRNKSYYPTHTLLEISQTLYWYFATPYMRSLENRVRMQWFSVGQPLELITVSSGKLDQINLAIRTRIRSRYSRRYRRFRTIAGFGPTFDPNFS
jgi:hypothetical protein